MIRERAFILFLENGYEATNIRDICKEVGIKASSLYFHYSSKQELFFYIYNDILNQEINFLNTLTKAIHNLEPKLRFYEIYKNKYEFCAKNITRQKFLLRYHLFPPKEIEGALNDIYKIWRNEENTNLEAIIEACTKSGLLEVSRSNEYLAEYKRFEDYQIYQMIITNIKMNDEGLKLSWKKFWKSIA